MTSVYFNQSMLWILISIKINYVTDCEEMKIIKKKGNHNAINLNFFFFIWFVRRYPPSYKISKFWSDEFSRIIIFSVSCYISKYTKGDINVIMKIFLGRISSKIFNPYKINKIRQDFDKPAKKFYKWTKPLTSYKLNK